MSDQQQEEGMEPDAAYELLNKAMEAIAKMQPFHARLIRLGAVQQMLLTKLAEAEDRLSEDDSLEVVDLDFEEIEFEALTRTVSGLPTLIVEAMKFSALARQHDSGHEGVREAAKAEERAAIVKLVLTHGSDLLIRSGSTQRGVEELARMIEERP